MNDADPQFTRMTTAPVGGLIASLSVPTVISMLVSAVYNMADTYFVSKLGTSASGAVGIVFSLMAIIQAFGFTLGMGSGTWISRLLGARRTGEAGRVASSGFASALVIGTALAVLGTAFLDPLMHVLGATDTILPYARDYARYILLAAPVMASSFVLNNTLRAEGKARYSMAGIAFGGILNCFLDPLFIFAFRMGIAGAAVATALSQFASLAVLLAPYLRGKTSAKLGLGGIARSPDVYLKILRNGFPSFCRQGLSSASTIVLNINAAVYGDAAVAAMAIVGKIFLFIFSIIIGVGQGFQPVVGYNYGAQIYDRVREAFHFLLRSGTLLMTAFGVLVFAAAPHLMRFFIARDAEVVAIGTLALRAQCLAMPLLALGVACNMTFQVIGKSWTATFLSVLRQGVFFLPLILVLPRFLGLAGVQITQPLADAFTFLVNIPFAVSFLRRLGRRMDGSALKV